MFAESIGNTAKLFFAVSCQSSEEFAEGHCCDSRALLNLAIMGEPAHNGVHYFLKEYSNFHAASKYPVSKKAYQKKSKI